MRNSSPRVNYYRFLLTSVWGLSMVMAIASCLAFIMLKANASLNRSSAVSFVVVINGVESELIHHPNSLKELQAEISKRMLSFTPDKHIVTYLDADGSSIEIRSNEEFISFISYYKNPIFSTIKLYVEDCCKAVTPWKKETIYQYDVVVIGSGAAGLAAAISATQTNPGLSICIIEKEGQFGGDSIKATSGMSACGTQAQKEEGIPDTVEKFYADTVKSGQGFSNETLVKVLANNSKDAWDFLMYMDVNLTKVTQCGGHSISRTHRPTNKTVGFAIVSGLKKYVESPKGAKIVNLTRCQAKEFIYDPKEHKIKGIVVSIEDRNTIIRAKSVVLATGGYGHDYTETSLLAEFAPTMQHLPTTTGKQAVGEGVKMARRIGAELIQMDKVQVHPTGFIDPNDPNAKTKFLAPELLRGVGGIMINETGDRFCNELGYRDYVSSQIIRCCRPRGEYPQAISVILLNENAVQMFGPTLKFYIDKKMIRKFNSLEELTTTFGVSLPGLKLTLQKYKEAARKGIDEFNKTVFPTVFKETDTFYAGQITPVVHYTMGGIRINERAEVIAKDGERIGGLYAAGEVAGGVHGKNRLVGNSLLECIVFGRIAGESAALNNGYKSYMCSAN
eukprot:TRINITY_DN10798_c0_g1_i1.p1 TRINITY_DN10798_c0_g1~~TRINITY_DN10798_c0_g1_i1.p1  ORF type:complete len:618 (+),score=143.64 TRINITY_DN10798_c0_g1_i1:166-2019(+)